MEKNNRIFTISLVILFFATAAFAATASAPVSKSTAPDKSKTPSANEKPGTPAKSAKGGSATQVSVPANMSNEKLIGDIKTMLSTNIKIRGMVPDIEFVQGADGKVSLFYKKKDGTKMPLENVDRKTLEEVFLKVRAEYDRAQNEKTLKMLKDIKNIQEMNRQQRMLRTINNSTSKIYKPTVPVTRQSTR